MQKAVRAGLVVLTPAGLILELVNALGHFSFGQGRIELFACLFDQGLQTRGLSSGHTFTARGPTVWILDRVGGI